MSHYRWRVVKFFTDELLKLDRHTKGLFVTRKAAIAYCEVLGKTKQVNELFAVERINND